MFAWQRKRWHHLLGLVMVVGMLGGSGCTAAAKPTSFREVADPAGWVLGDTAAYLVVTESNWSQYYDVRPGGADFQAGTCLVAYWGMRPNPGYGVKIVGVERTGDEVTVKVEFREPEPGKVYPQVIVYPVSVVQVARTDLGSGLYNFVFVDGQGRQLVKFQAQV